MSSAAIALAVGLGAPAHAQNQADSTSIPVLAPPSPRNDDAVGPAQLRDFSLNGTVTRQADAPATAPPRPAERQTATAAAPATQGQATPATSAPRPAPSAVATRSNEGSAPATPSAPSTSAFSFPPPTPANNQPASFGPSAIPSTASLPAAEPFATSEANLLSKWPWFLAFLTAAGAALWYFRRHRTDRYAFAGAESSAFELSPQPAPPRAAPRPEPGPRPPVPAASPKPATPAAGIVSTRLRPWLDIDFSPEAAIVDEEKGSIQFEVTIYNSGSAPARDVLVEAAMFNAGPDQDEVIGQFFERPSASGEGVAIPPLQSMSFRSLVTLPRDQLRIFEVEGRSLFVPLVGFNASYRWSGGQGQTSTSFLVGRNTNGEKMGPFRVDQGRRHSAGLRRVRIRYASASRPPQP
ncbi:hypothetical protein [Sphingomonas daechungensis]|uniref:hypothetical protein n=1 Tax=Sphingomonas daechungensis TaxID=1176646 RepID=UPI001CB8E3C9|nr:hypothetical protein [Sphingomonas daechungensis]